MTAGFAHHGGRLREACDRFGGRPEEWIDLSTGINPNGWRPVEPLAIDWRCLPDTNALTQLEQMAARYFGCDPALCVAVPGSETGLRLLAPLLDLPGLHQSLAYGTYRAAFAQRNMLADPLALPARATALVLGNPNNPDGKLFARDDLLALLDHQERHGGWLVVDEAFADCDPGWSIAADVCTQRRLIVLRSFGKFFGLAGLRLGFVIAPPAILAGVRQALGDWPLHAAALAFGSAAYADAAWIAATRRDLPRRAAALDAVLVRHGLTPQGACPLFRLVAAPGAGALFEPLARHRILARPFANHPDLLRIGLPADDRALDRLEAALG